MTKRWLIIFSLVWLSPYSSAQSLEQKIDAFVAKYQPTSNMGLAVGVVKNGQIIFFKGYGYRDKENHLPVTSSTLFAIGSNTKSFTSLAISLLSDEGKAQLELPIAPQFDGFAMMDSNVTKQITPIDILSHRSGLPRHDLLWYFTPFSRDELFHKIPFLAMNAHSNMGFRQSFQYNNLMYTAIGVWTEQITGNTWETVIGKRILAPLGMSATNFTVGEMQKSSNHANPYVGDLALPYHNCQSIVPAGGINSNVEDLAKWLQFHLQGGVTTDGTRLISEAAHKRLFKPETDLGGAFPNNKVSYGLGWFLSDVGQNHIVWHGGNIDGFSTFISFVPGKDLGLIILTNESNGTAFEFPTMLPGPNGGPAFKGLPLIILEDLLGVSAPESVAISPSLGLFDFAKGDSGSLFQDLIPQIKREFRLISKFVRPTDTTVNSTDYTGHYSERAYGDFNVSSVDGQLTMGYYANQWALVPAGDADQFLIQIPIGGQIASLPLSFKRSQGLVTGATVPMEEEVGPIVFLKQ